MISSKSTDLDYHRPLALLGIPSSPTDEPQFFLEICISPLWSCSNYQKARIPHPRSCIQIMSATIIKPSNKQRLTAPNDKINHSLKTFIPPEEKCGQLAHWRKMCQRTLQSSGQHMGFGNSFSHTTATQLIRSMTNQPELLQWWFFKVNVMVQFRTPDCYQVQNELEYRW